MQLYFSEHAKEKLRNSVHYTSSKCSQQVENELRETFTRLELGRISNLTLWLAIQAVPIGYYFIWASFSEFWNPILAANEVTTDIEDNISDLDGELQKNFHKKHFSQKKPKNTTGLVKWRKIGKTNLIGSKFSWRIIDKNSFEKVQSNTPSICIT